MRSQQKVLNYYFRIKQRRTGENNFIFIRRNGITTQKYEKTQMFSDLSSKSLISSLSGMDPGTNFIIKSRFSMSQKKRFSKFHQRDSSFTSLRIW